MKITMNEARLWRIERKDGVVIGFTDHSHDIDFDGVNYRANNLISASEVASALGVSGEHGELTGGFDHESLSRDDFLSGRYQSAKIEQFLFDWERKELGACVFRGLIGKVELVGERFQVEIHSPFEKLNNVYGRNFRKECDAKFCDDACGLKVENFQFEVEITKLDDRFLWVSFPNCDYDFSHGSMELQDKEKVQILSAKPDVIGIKIELWRTPVSDLVEGHRVLLIAGCDKRFESCVNRFRNAINFRGFPHMPGEKILHVPAE